MNVLILVLSARREPLLGADDQAGSIGDQHPARVNAAGRQVADHGAEPDRGGWRAQR